MPIEDIDPYAGRTTLDRHVDTLLDRWAGETYAEEELREVALPGDRTGYVVCRRQGRAPARVSSGAPAVVSRKAQGELDRKALRAAIADPGTNDKARGDFEDMLDRIHPEFGDYPSLTDRQRSYVENVLAELGIDADDPAERNRNVPRGREVPLAFNAHLPLSPPGRVPVAAGAPLDRHEIDRDAGRNVRTAIPLSRCMRSLGGGAVDCLACGGDCPHP